MEGQAAAMAEKIHDAVAALPPSDPSRRPPLRLRRRPSTASTSSDKNATVFRANVLTLIAKLPSAAAPTGFASLWSAGEVTCGLCFGYATPSQCRECLAAAAKKITDGCGAHGAGVWTNVCFASYADLGRRRPRYQLVPRASEQGRSWPPTVKRLGKLVNDHPVLTALLGIAGGGLAVAAFYVLIEGICCWMESKIRPINNAAVVPVAGLVAVRAEVEMEMNPPAAATQGDLRSICTAATTYSSRPSLMCIYVTICL